MLSFIIYLVLVVIVTALSTIAKEDETEFLGLYNPKLRRLTRTLFVILLMFAVFNPFPLITDFLAYNADAATETFANMAQFGLNIFAGFLTYLLTWCAIQILKWIWK